MAAYKTGYTREAVHGGLRMDSGLSAEDEAAAMIAADLHVKAPPLSSRAQVPSPGSALRKSGARHRHRHKR
jgi:hypothetical protein